MDAILLINDLRQAIKHVKHTGQDIIPINRLNAYLDEIEKISKSSQNNSEQEEIRIDKEIQQSQKKFENDMEIYKIRSAESLAMFQSAIDAGVNALKSSIIINGGAAVALLAFIGGIIKQPSNTSAVSLSCIGYALLIFMIGAGLAGSATGGRYICQTLFCSALSKNYSEHQRNYPLYIGRFINFITILAGGLSFSAFFYGGWISYSALIK